jgi:methylenetetrahydrofolate--tRNA-(uracil-5-)-methyltransferase
MKPNFGLLPPLEQPVRGKKRRYQAYSQRALDDLKAYVDEAGIEPESEEA